MAEDRYSYEEIGRLFCRGGIKIGTTLSFEDENSLIKEIPRAVNTGAQYIEIASLGRHGAARSFGLSSSLASEIRRLGKFNGISFGVHVSPYLNISGLVDNGFSIPARNQTIQEAKGAIDFAHAINAKIIVLHPNSFPRTILNVGDGEFSVEGTSKTYFLVDPLSERIIMGLTDQDMVYIPQQARDTRGNPIWLLGRDGRHIVDPDTGNPIPRLAVGRDGRIMAEQISFAEYVRRMQKNNTSLKDIIMRFLYIQRAGEVNSAYLHLIEAERALPEAQSRRDRLQETLRYANELNGSMAPEERWRLERNIQDRLTSYGIPVPAETRSLISLIEDELDSNQRIIENSRQVLSRGWPQLTNFIAQLRDMRLLEDHGLEKISEAIAELGEYCITISASDTPIGLAIENLPQPAMYGSLPLETLAIINGSRNTLSLRLQKRGYGNTESKKLAREIIGATLDVGHLNLCRQFYKGDEGDAFHKWTLSQVRDLIKSGVIYNLHLSDNHGMDDSHLLLGEGNAPIKEVLRVLADADYKGFIVIEGAGAPETTKHTWNLLGILPRATDDELIRPFSPRQALYGLKWKDDPERPWFGREE